jgi:hypothetical protein
VAAERPRGPYLLVYDVSGYQAIRVRGVRGLGIVATVAASALVTIILSGPEQVIAVLRLL